MAVFKRLAITDLLGYKDLVVDGLSFDAHVDVILHRVDNGEITVHDFTVGPSVRIIGDTSSVLIDLSSFTISALNKRFIEEIKKLAVAYADTKPDYKWEQFDDAGGL